jgi:hypothetical protein
MMPGVGPAQLILFAPRVRPSMDETRMDETRRLEDLSVDELKSALLADNCQLSDDQLMAVRDYVWRVGGIHYARKAVQVLTTINRAA